MAEERRPAVYFTVQETAHILGKSRQQVWTYITKLDNTRALKAKKVDGHWYIHPDDLDNFVENYRSGQVFKRCGCRYADGECTPRPIPEIKHHE